MPGESTIRHVAARARVSTATVSAVVNRSRRVSDELSKRVWDAVAEVGYTPNGIARSLRQRYTATIGLVVPDNSNPFFAEIAKGVENEGFDAGYSVIICNSNGLLERETRLLESLMGRRVDGIIYFGSSSGTDHLRPLVGNQMPLVVFNREIDNSSVDSFQVDNYRIGYIGTRYLTEMGHVQIACVGPAALETPSARRVDGYKQALVERGLTWDEELVQWGDNHMGGGKEAMRRILSSGLTFSAVFATNDLMAMGAIAALREAKLRVPEDVSVVGVDDIPFAAFTDPPLTTVAIPKAEAGRQAVGLLIERLTGAFSGEGRRVMLECKLIVRSSCAVHPSVASLGRGDQEKPASHPRRLAGASRPKRVART